MEKVLQVQSQGSKLEIKVLEPKQEHQGRLVRGRSTLYDLIIKRDRCRIYVLLSDNRIDLELPLQ